MPDRAFAAGAVLYGLEQIIESRKDKLPDGSYVTQLLLGGSARIKAKVDEEAEELIVAVGEASPACAANTIHEAADLLFHTLVLFGWAGVSLVDVEAELSRRFGTSGLLEKSLRGENC